ncbi:MAG: YidC/Oxa1 family membrane protein insertase [Candidatus Saccharibacteria bacterium]|nr:YidC/Oxa1 family membrane protein insertase [Candidatus Saccharibacteria bacterium]
MDIFQLLIVQPIFNLLIVIYSIIPGGDFGVAVIIFTVLVRLAMWPLVKKQLHQTKAMQKMQPELARIKKETKGNKQLEGVKMMELYKKHDISPFRSIGILLIQVPIFIALYQVIQIFTLHRDKIDQYTYAFVKALAPVQDLIAHPEHFNETSLGIISMTGRALTTNPFSINIVLMILAIGAAYTQYIMAKQITPKNKSKKRLRDIMSEASAGKEADKSEMNSIMMGSMTKFLPVMMFLIIINLPGAIALYYTVSNIVAVFQQSRVLKEDTDEMIEIADEAPVTVHKKATAKARAKDAQPATIIRIKAKDQGSWQGKKKG